MTLSRSHVYPMISQAQIKSRVEEMGRQIAADYQGKDLLLIGLLNGVYVFFADLARAIDLDLEVSFLRVASYGSGMESTGEVKVISDIDHSIRGRHVLLVEDIIDTGLTLHSVLKLLQDRGPESLKICTLLDKPSRRRVDVTGDYVGFSIDDHFVVGYGLDLDGKYRNLPYVGIYQPVAQP